MRRATKVVPFLLLFLLCYAYGAPELVISGAECQTTATQTYVDPWGVTQSDQTIDLYVAKDGISIDYIDPAYGQGHNGAAIYWAIGKDIMSADKWGILTFTCEVGESLHAYVSGSTARSYAGISTSNYIIDFLVEPEYVCDTVGECDPSHGCYFDGTLNNGEPTTVYVYKDTPSAHVIFLNTWNFDMPSSATEGDTITISYPYTSAGRASTVTLYYSYDKTNWTTLATRSFDADESGTLSGSITLPRNEEHDKVWVKAHITIDDLSYNPCTTNIESAAFDIDILDASPSLTLTVTPSQPSSSDTITLTIDKVTPDPVSTLKIYVDGSLQDTINSPTFPYTYSLGTLAEGSHTIEVEATEDDGDTGSVSTTISVSAGGGGGGSGSSEQFPDGYQYRIPITISNSGSSDLEGYQIAIDLDSSSPVWDHAQSDLSDVMFMWTPPTDLQGFLDLTELTPSGKVCWHIIDTTDNIGINLYSPDEGTDVLGIAFWSADKTITISNNQIGTWDIGDWFCLTWGNGEAHLTQNGTEIWSDSLSYSPLKARLAGYAPVSLTIPHWIESLDTTNKTAKIWVRVPKIPANGSTTIYMYYGNPSATSQSDGDTVFNFFDDFDDGVMDWSVQNKDVAEIYESGGALHIDTEDMSTTTAGSAIVYKQITLSPNSVVEIHVYDQYGSVQNKRAFFGLSAEGFDNYQRPCVAVGRESDYSTYVALLWTSSQKNLTQLSTASVGWHTFSIVYTTDNFILSDGVESSTFPPDITPYAITFGVDLANDPYDYSGNWSVDWVRVRKYADPEPTATVGAEEESSACPSGSLNFSMTYDDTEGRLELYACPDNQIYTGGDVNICTPDDSECFTITACGFYYVSVNPSILKYRILVASDGHYGQPDTNYTGFYEDLVNWVHAEDVNYVVLVGDLVHDNPDYLSDVKTYLDQFGVPYYVVYGNHDHATENDWEQLWGYPRNHYVILDDNFALIFLNTSNESGDYLCPDTTWLSNTLDTLSDKKVIIFQHIADATIDSEYGVDCPDERSIIQSHDNIVAVISGHNHDMDYCVETLGTYWCFDGHFGGSWGTSYRGYRIIEIYSDGKVVTYQYNPQSETKVNSDTLHTPQSTCYYAKYTNSNGCTYTSDVQCVDTTDQTPPNVSISLSTGTDSACYGESAYVKAEVSDNWTLPENMSVSGTIDGTSVTWTWDSSISAWKATAVTDVLGEHTVEVTATDEGGLSTTETYTYTVTDCDAPTVSIGGIDVSEDGASWEAYGGSVEEGWYVRVSASATDNVGVDHIDVYDNGELVGTISGDSGTVSWQVSGVGDHTITVRAEDTSGLSAVQETSITVVEATQPYVVATISYTPTSPTVGDTVTFTANVDSTCGEVTSYTWDLGCDGTTDGTLSTFEHTFDAEGDYCVSLTVSTDGGCTSTDSVTITVTSVENTSGMEIDVPDNATITRFYIDTDYWYTTYITPYIQACHTFSVEGIADDPNYYWTAYFYLSDVNLAEDNLKLGSAITLLEFTLPSVGSVKRCVDVFAPDGVSEYLLAPAYLQIPKGTYGGANTGRTYYVWEIDPVSPVVVLLTRCPMAEYDDGVFKLTLPLRGFTGKVEWYVNGNLVRVDEVEHPDITKPTYLSYTASLAPMTEVEVRAYAKDKLGNYISPAVCTYTVGIPSPEQVYNTFSGYLQPVISKLMSPEVVYVTLSSYTPGGLAIVSAVGEKENILPYNMDWLLALSVALAILGAWAWYRRRMA